MVVRKRVRREEVATPDLGPIQPQLTGREVEETLHDEHALLSPGSPDRRHDRAVGEGDAELAVVVREIVGAEQRALRVDRQGEAIRVVGARVVHEHVLHPQDPPIRAQRDLGLMQLSPLLGRREEVLEPVLDPLHRPAEAHRDPGKEHFVRIEHHDLGAEAAADERGDDPNLRLGEAQHGGEPVADRDRRLGGVPDGQLGRALVPVCQNPAVLHRRRDAPIVREISPEDEIGGGACGLVVALRLNGVRRQVGSEVLVDDRSSLGEGGPDVGHGVQGLEIHDHIFHRILGHVAALRHDDGDRLSDVADFISGERHLCPRMEGQPLDRRRRHEQRPGLPVLAEVRRREDTDHAGPLEGRRRVHASKETMRHFAPHERGVQRAGESHIVDEGGPAREERLVLVAPDPRPEVPRAHGFPPRSAAAASTASTIF